eukprot:765230-Hanusia_phi.AAC.5
MSIAGDSRVSPVSACWRMRGGKRALWACLEGEAEDGDLLVVDGVEPKLVSTSRSAKDLHMVSTMSLPKRRFWWSFMRMT